MMKHNKIAKKRYIILLLSLFIVLLPGFSFSLYSIVDPWADRAWLNGWYTAAICLEQKDNLTPYAPAIPPDLPNGSIVYTVGDLNNYISYGSEGAYYNQPQRYSYECNCECDDEGCSCSTCYGCRYERKFVTIGSLGFSAGAWDIDRYGAALETIEYRKWTNTTLAGDRDGVAAELQNALSRYLEAEQFYQACKASATYGAANYLADSYGDINVQRWISYEQYLALAHPSQPQLPGQPCNVNMPSANGPACKEYPVKWREAARSAMAALTKSLQSADKNTELLQQQYERMDYAGLCDEDYNEEPKTTCLKTREALTIINQRTKEAAYGQIALALEKKKDLQQKVYCFPPDFSDYNAAMEYLWAANGFNPKVVNLKADAEAAFMQANSIYNDYYARAAELKTRAEEAGAGLEKEKPHMITEAVAVDAFNKTKVGTIAERAAAWKESKEKGDNALSAATTLMAHRQKGYLKGGTAKIKEAIAAYEGLEVLAGGIKGDGALVANEKRNAARSLLQQLAGFYQRNKNERVAYYYQQAQQALVKGDRAQTLGDKYVFYSGAVNYAMTGLNNGNMIENETLPLALQLADLVRRAEMDGINTETEKTLLNSMERDGAYDRLLLQQCLESIITKAGLKYGDLSDKKAELLRKINASGECGADLGGDLRRADGNLVGTTGIDYINALGKLKKIAEEYALIDEELGVCQEKIALAEISVEKIISNGGMIKIDEPVRVSVFLLISNLGTEKGAHINIPVDLGINMTLLLSDITNGRENVESVRSEGAKTVLTIKEIKPLRTFSINAEKNAVLARTISLERTATGTANKNRDVEIVEKRQVEVYGAGRLVLPDGASDVLINGKSSVYIKPGAYDISYSYKKKDAYAVKEEIETVGLLNDVQVKKKIAIRPALDITSLSFYIPFGYQNVSRPGVTSLEAVIANKECGGAGCSFEIRNLKANKTVNIYVEFTVDDAQTELPGLTITKPDPHNCFGSGKKCDELPSDLQMMLAGINAAKEANDTATALRLKEEYETAVAGWEMEQRWIYDEIMEIKGAALKENAEIESALEKAKRNNSMVSELGKRRDLLEETVQKAENAQTLREELALLEGLKKEDGKTIVANYLRNSTEEYNKFKERLAKTGETGTPPQFIQVEQKLSELELTGDMNTAVELADALAEAEDYVKQQEEEGGKKMSDINNEYLLVKQNATLLAKDYKEQQNEAAGTEWESLFSADAERMERIGGEIEEAIAEGNYKLARTRMEQLQKQVAVINDVLEQARKEAEEMLLNARNSYLARREGMGWDARQMFEEKIKAIAEAALNRRYVEALKLARQVIDAVAAYKPETMNLWLAAIAVGVAAAAAGVYYMKMRGAGLGGFKLGIPGFTKKKREYKKLERINE